MDSHLELDVVRRVVGVLQIWQRDGIGLSNGTGLAGEWFQGVDRDYPGTNGSTEVLGAEGTQWDVLPLLNVSVNNIMVILREEMFVMSCSSSLKKLGDRTLNTSHLDYQTLVGIPTYINSPRTPIIHEDESENAILGIIDRQTAAHLVVGPSHEECHFQLKVHQTAGTICAALLRIVSVLLQLSAWPRDGRATDTNCGRSAVIADR